LVDYLMINLYFFGVVAIKIGKSLYNDFKYIYNYNEAIIIGLTP